MRGKEKGTRRGRFQALEGKGNEKPSLKSRSQLIGIGQTSLLRGAEEWTPVV